MPVGSSCWCKHFKRQKRSLDQANRPPPVPGAYKRRDRAARRSAVTRVIAGDLEAECRTSLKPLQIPEAAVDIEIQPMADQEYKELLEVQGLLGLQLVASGATSKDMQQYPARMTKEDGLRLLHFAKARQSFMRYANEEGHLTPLGIEAVRIDIRCSQETLDTLVKAVYSRTLKIGPSNAAELLAVADYLQAEFLVSAIVAYIRGHTSAENAIQLFCLGRGYPTSLLREAAVEAACVARDRHITAQLLHATSREDVTEQMMVLRGMARHAPLTEVMEVIEENEARGGWLLEEGHLRLLMELYPSLQNPLKALAAGKSTQMADLCQRRSLFSMCIAALDNSHSIEWRLPVSHLERVKKQSPAVVCSPGTLLVDSLRRFELQLQFIDGKWGLYVNAVNTAWRRDDKFDIVCIAQPDHKIRVQWVPIMNEGSSFGIRRTFNWLDRKQLLLEGGTVFGARLEKLHVSSGENAAV